VRVMLLLSMSLSLLTFCAGCSNALDDLPTVTVTARDHTFQVAARGELIASESIPIGLPGGIRMSFNIAWLIPEYSEVKQGQLIALFDDTEVLSSREYSVLEVANQELEMETHVRMSAIDLKEIDHEAMRVEGETDIARNYVEVDPALFSRNEIIDAIGDLDYLMVEGAYHEWKANTHEQRADAERVRISAGKAASQTKLEKQDAALALMELRSPTDGTFVYGRTPWGQKLQKGQQVFAGRPVGLLPIRGKVRARIFVPEFDAVGIEVGQSAVVKVDSDLTRDFPASVSSVSAVAIPRYKSDPQKYIVVEAELAEIDADLMLVGSNLSATLNTGTVEEAFLLPQQSVFYEDEGSFVFVVEGGRSEARRVTLGRRSSTLIEITDGLQAGDRVSVAPPGAGGA
jgi:HlyD family secretion protein